VETARRACPPRTPTFLYFRRRRHLWSSFATDVRLVFVDAGAADCNRQLSAQQ